MATKALYATGRRKTAVARVWLKAGNGKVLVNAKEFDNYFTSDAAAKNIVNLPFSITETLGKFDVLATVSGGGYSSQAEALRHGISRALLLADPDYRTPLKKAGLLTRDAREKERKKYGLAKARKRFQYSKR